MAEQDDSPRQAIVNKLFGSIFGNVEQKIEVKNDDDNDTLRHDNNNNNKNCGNEPAESPVYLSTVRGTKIDFIRIMNCLYELGFFTDDKGGRISKKDVMAALGKAVNVDLTDYQNDLSRSLSDSTKLEKHLAVFNRLRDKMEEVFDNYGG